MVRFRQRSHLQPGHCRRESAGRIPGAVLGWFWGLQMVGRRIAPQRSQNGNPWRFRRSLTMPGATGNRASSRSGSNPRD